MRVIDPRTFRFTLALASAVTAVALAVGAGTERLAGPSALAVLNSPISTIVLLALAWLTVGSLLRRYMPKSKFAIAITVAGPLLAAVACLLWWRHVLINDTIGPTSVLWMAAALVAAAVAAGAAPARTRAKEFRGGCRYRWPSVVLALTIPAALATPPLTLPPTYLPGHLTTTGVTPGQAPQQRELSEDTEVLWVREILDDGLATIFPTELGPVIVTRTQAQLLDPATGETAWSYSRGAKNSPIPIQGAAITTGENPALELEFDVHPTDSSAYYSQVVRLDPTSGQTLGWQDEYSANLGSPAQMPSSSFCWQIDVQWEPSPELQTEVGRIHDVSFTLTVPIDKAYLSGTPHPHCHAYDTGDMYLMVVELNGAPRGPLKWGHKLIYALH
ncbi:hypothetical protein [Actinobaculum sp. 352]|uniref:hypothetical protein n=1 Tax=Actinobaculum sp. 352 TaxID=2490946 RepID=UPI000F7F5ECF|nr:hypothetical protein [Actinobaculum sp. 352]RTE49194.1 hypothetical protein EKN07_06350 [Actinobaculum sp. 352]